MIFHVQAASPTGTVSMAVAAPTLESAVKRARRSGLRDAEPFVGPHARLYYKIQKCEGC